MNINNSLIQLFFIDSYANEPITFKLVKVSEFNVYSGMSTTLLIRNCPGYVCTHSQPYPGIYHGKRIYLSRNHVRAKQNS